MENCYWQGNYASWSYHPAAVVTPWGPACGGAAGNRATSASRSHSEAEKRRRDRINAQLATLRNLIPMSEKMDKAALLGHVVEHVRKQSKIARDVIKSPGVPTETDEVSINDYIPASSQENQNIYLRASICCDDRPELFSEINRAVMGLGLTIHQADIMSIGGRTKSNLVLYANNNNNNNNCNYIDEGNTCRESIKQSLKLALNRVVVSIGSSGYVARSKRQRFFYPNYR